VAIYIDSAIIEEVKAVRSLSWVRGGTTNLVLLAKAGSEAEIVGPLPVLKATPTENGF
jgi:hypothetical protein